MKQKFTTEKHKYLENKNVKNETMFNFKISCLMKKQLINVMMTLAIVFGLSVSAMAQNEDGLTPATARLGAVGSVSSFTVTEDGSATVDPGDVTYAWVVKEIDGTSAFDADLSTATSEVGDGVKFLDGSGAETTDYTTASVNIQWLEVPDNASNVYAVEVTSTSTEGGSGNANCSTIRRFFIAVFDYDIWVYLSDENGAEIETADGTDWNFTDFDATTVNEDCNSWGGLVLHNGTEADPNEDNYLTNPEYFARTHDGRTASATSFEKTTETYFSVRIALTNAPANYDLDQLAWRLRYNTETNTNLNLYEINYHGSSTDASATCAFSAESGSGGTTAITGEEADDYVLAIASPSNFGSNSSIFFDPINSSDTDANNMDAIYTFQVRSHNLLGDLDMQYSIMVDEVNLNLQGDANYNDGIKVADATADELGVSKDRTEIMEIQMSPATSTIGITD